MVVKIFRGLAREEVMRRQANTMSPAAAPQQLVPDRDGRLVRLVTCPKCGNKGLPYHNALDAAWTAQCGKCAALFAFHPRGVMPDEAIQRNGHRSRHPLIRTRGEGKRKYVDGNKHAEWDLERRQAGRRAFSKGLL